MFGEGRVFEDQDHVRELNRLFLSFLHNRAHERLGCLGLNDTTVATLRATPPVVLEQLAYYPGALFRLKLDALRAPLDDARPFSADPAQLSLQSGILNGVWHLAQRSTFGVRLHLAMRDADVDLLRSMPLLELSRLALTVELVGCAYLESEWVWTELLTETRPEYRRYLLLVGMQPNVAADCRLARTGVRASR